MTALVWDETGDRTFHAGLDRGVLYLPGGGYAWNGLLSVDDATPSSVQPYYQDGQKYYNHQLRDEFEGTLRAFTYPDAFDQCQGTAALGGGLHAHDQSGTSFGLSYRTKVGDDVQGLDRGYVIHLLYNLTAQPDSRAYSTIGQTAEASELSWKLTSVPVPVPGNRRPSSHFTIKAFELNPVTLAGLEEILYGTFNTAPSLPPVASILTYIGG